jgi:hypothetical protein
MSEKPSRLFRTMAIVIFILCLGSFVAASVGYRLWREQDAKTEQMKDQNRIMSSSKVIPVSPTYQTIPTPTPETTTPYLLPGSKSRGPIGVVGLPLPVPPGGDVPNESNPKPNASK